MRFGCCVKPSIWSIGLTGSPRQPYVGSFVRLNRCWAFLVIFRCNLLARLSSIHRRLPTTIRRQLP